MSSNKNKSDFKNKLMLAVCVAGVIASIWGMVYMATLVNSKAPKEPTKATYENNHENVVMVDMFAEDYDSEAEADEEEETEASVFDGIMNMGTEESGDINQEESVPSEVDAAIASDISDVIETSSGEKVSDKNISDKKISIGNKPFSARLIPLPAGGMTYLRLMTTTEELTALPEYMSWKNTTPDAEVVEKWDPEHKVNPALFNAHTIHLGTVETIGEAAAFYGETRLGMPYSQARRDSGEAYDCSSFVYWSYMDAGLDISVGGAHTAALMAERFKNNGCELTSGALMAGDLIFYSYEANENFMGIDHVAMVVGDGNQIEASSIDGYVAEKPVSLYHAVLIVRPNAAGGRVSTEVFSNIQALLSEPMIATPSEMEEMTEEIAEETIGEIAEETEAAQEMEEMGQGNDS